MKINNRNLKSSKKEYIHDKSKNKIYISGDKENFASYLSKITHDSIENELDDLFNDIKEKGNNLKEHLTRKNFEEYKKAVKEFLMIIQDKYVKAVRTYARGKKGTSKYFTIIKKVNEDLLKLQELFFQEQAEELKIVQKIDEIKGLLLNLYS